MAAEMARSSKIYIVNHGHPDGAARDRGFLVFNRLNVASFRGAAAAAAEREQGSRAQGMRRGPKRMRDGWPEHGRGGGGGEVGMGGEAAQRWALSLGGSMYAR